MLDAALPADRELASSRGVALPQHVLVLVAALAAAVVAQGGYYVPGRMLTAGLTFVAVLLTLRVRARMPFGWVPAACAALAGWAIVRALIGGGVLPAMPAVLAAGCLAAAMIVAQRADSAQRELCAAVAVGIGVLVALTGWIAVVWRISSWSTVAEGLYRASSTLTYPNASAALLAALALLATAIGLTRPGAPLWTVATCLLLTGLGATLSRAGMLAFLAGLVILALLAGIRATARQIAPPALGAVVAIGGLSRSFPTGGPSGSTLAILGLLGGIAVAVGLTRLPARISLAGLGVATTALVAAAVASGQFHTRVELSSPDRAGATRAALDIVGNHPLIGVGPGKGWISWTPADGHARVIRYAHNEYLQVLLELGAIGLALLGCLLVAMFLILRRGKAGAERPQLWAGAAAGLTALTVHSGFDFLWHLPVIILFAGLLLGLAAPNEKEST